MIRDKSPEELRSLCGQIDSIQASDTREASRAELKTHETVIDEDVARGMPSPLEGLLSDPQAPLTPRRDPDLPELRLFLRTLETALKDAAGGGKGNDWVTTLDARDWIREISWDALQEIAPDAAPRADLFQEWKGELELLWANLDSRAPESIVARLEAPGRRIPVGLVTVYLLDCQYLSIKGERELVTLNEKVAALVAQIKEEDDVKITIHEIASLAQKSVPRIKHVASSAAINADKLLRLQELVERRGLES
jgi:hypothetical protein